MKQCFTIKNFYSLVLMALVNADCLLIWASIGAPGNTRDSTLLKPLIFGKESLEEI